MAKKKLLDFTRVGKSANKTNLKIVGKMIGGALIGEALPSVFQRISGKQASGPVGNVLSGVITTVIFLAANQKEMAAGVVATKTVKAIVTYGNPVAAKFASVPLALPSTKQGYTVNADPNAIPQIPANVGVGDDVPPGAKVEELTLPNGQRIKTFTRDENPTVNYDTGGRGDAGTLSEFISEASLNESLADRFGTEATEMLGDGVFDETMGM